MADQTFLPTSSSLAWYQYSRKDASAPRLAAPIDADDNSLSLTNPLKDETGAVLTGKAFHLGIEKQRNATGATTGLGWVETIFVPTGTLNYDAQTAGFTLGEIITGGTSGARAQIVQDTDNGTSGILNLLVISGTFQDNEALTGSAGGGATVDGTLTNNVSADGLTISNVIRGIDPGGLDITVGDPSFADTHLQGEPVFCNITAGMMEVLRGVIQGLVATGASDFIIGIDAAGTVTIKRSSGAGTALGFLRWNTSNSKAEFSNDGTNWTAFDDTVASVLIKVTASDTTPSYLNTKVDGGDGITTQVTSPGGDERLQIDVNASDLADGTAGIEVNSNNFEIKTDSDSGLQIDGSGNLEAKLKVDGGISKDANGLFLDDNPVVSATFGEDIDGSSTPKAAFISAGTSSSEATVVQEQKSYNSGGDHDIYGVNLGSQTFTMSTYEDTITRVELLLEEFGNPSGDFRMRIFAVDGSSKPTGSALATETTPATGIGVTVYRWTNFTLSSPLTVTPGTEYAIVVDVVLGDASNYVGWVHGNGNTYSDGQAWTSVDSGTTWSSFANDFCFRVWSYETQTAGRVYMSKNDEPYRGRVDGFVTTNTSSGNTGTIRMGGKQDSFSALTPGDEYYVSGTAGGVTTSTGGLKVGKAVSATEIVIDKKDSFIVSDKVTTESLDLISRAFEEEIFFNVGFPPSRIDIYVDMQLNTSTGSASRQAVITGKFVGTKLYANYVVTRLSGTDYADALNAQDVTSVTITDGNSDTFALDTMNITEAGFSCRFFSQQNTAGSSGQAILTIISYI